MNIKISWGVLVMYFNREKVQPPAGVVLPEYVPKGSELASILFESERAKGAEAKIK